MGAANLTRRAADHVPPARVGLQDGVQSMAVDVYMDIAVVNEDESGAESIVRVEARVVWNLIGGEWRCTDAELIGFGGIGEEDFWRRCFMTEQELVDEAERVAHARLVQTARVISFQQKEGL